MILIAQIDQHIAECEDPWSAVISATEHRLRPIMLTAAAAILGGVAVTQVADAPSGHGISIGARR